MGNADKNRLTELAKQQLELAYSPQNDAVYKRQWELNNCTGGTCPVVRIETEGLVHEIVPERLLMCKSPFARNIERRILHNIRHFELIGDDRIVPKTFPLEWHVNIDPYGFPILKEMARFDGINPGYRVNHAINCIEDDFDKLKPLSAWVDRKLTQQHVNDISWLIGDILPIEMIGWPKGVTFLTRSLLDIISMECLYSALYDDSKGVHRLMEYVLNNALILMEFYENEGIMYLNNRATDLGNSTYPLTDSLPASGYNGTPRLIDMFMRTDSQETLGVSPSMYGEFFFPYYQRLCERGGLWYYGCCEPVSDIWPKYLSQIENIKKLSISKWCNEEIIASHLANKPVVYSRKLDALFLGKDFGIDASGLSDYVKATVITAKGCQIEFLAREVQSFYGNTEKLRTAVDIIREVCLCYQQ